MEFPHKLSVASLVSSRYVDNRRPLSWDSRRAGIDVVKAESGQVMNLLSDGAQSPPQQGWTIMLTSGDPVGGFHWTLYGLPR